MKRTSLIVIFLLVSVTQNIMFYMQDINSQSFVIGFPDGLNEFSNLILLFILFAPLVIIFFFFSGSLQDLTNGYGKLVIIRNYSKNILLMKVIFKSLIETFFIISIQTFESYMFRTQNIFFDLSFIKSLCVYFVTVFSLVVMEMLIELNTDAQYACLAVIIYTFVSYSLKKIALNSLIIKVIFFPCVLFERFPEARIFEKNFLLLIILLIFVNLFLIILTLKRFRNIDIY